MAAPGILSLLLQLANGPVSTIATQWFDNSKDREAFQNAVELEILKNGKSLQDQAGSIIEAEAKSDSWITSSWRPLMMIVFVAIIAIHLLIVPYILSPILWMIGYPVPELMAIPDQIWTLLTIGIGGYVGGRSIEKAATNVAKVMKPKVKPNLEDF